MKRHRWATALALLTILLVLGLNAWFWFFRSNSLIGNWTNDLAYSGSPPGSLDLIIQDDNRVQVSALPGTNVWWVNSRYDLQLHGNSILIRSGPQVVSELIVKCRRGKIHIMDRFDPSQTLRLAKADD